MSSLKRAVVLSDEEQYNAWQKFARETSEEYKIFCDNPAYFAALEARSLPFERLDEFALQDDWERINAWGRGKAAEWIHLWRQECGNGINLAEVVFLIFGYNLVQSLKNFLLARCVLERAQAGRWVIFSSLETRRYPQFSGNAFLNYFLQQLAGERGIPYDVLEIAGTESKKPLAFDARPQINRIIVRMSKRVLKKVYSFFAPKTARPVDVLAYGAPRHLAALVDELLKRKVTLALYDFDIHRPIFLFCAKRGLNYILPEALNGKKNGADDFEGELLRNYRRIMEISSEKRFFSYEGRDLSLFVRDRLFGDLTPYFRALGRERDLYASLLELTRPKAFLVSEDFAPQRSFFASFMVSRGVRGFCVSHANLAVNFKIEDGHRLFGKSLTFVQSEFERDMYAARGWDPEKIKVLGTPRYDQWTPKVLQPQSDGAGAKRPYRLLCVGGALYPFTPDSIGYLGCHVYDQGELQKMFLRTILEAVQGLPLELVIKPHDVEDEPLWRKLSESSPAAPQVRTAKGSANFVDLMLDCDAIVVSTWSNTMVEAAIAGKPVFYVDIPPQRGPILSAWQRNRYCHIVSDAASLRREIEKRLDPGHRPVERPKGPQDSYFLGRIDAKNAMRVADVIETINVMEAK